MRKTSFILKICFGLLIAAFVLVSCAAEVEEKETGAIVSFGFDSKSKGLSATYGTLDPSEYYWFYKTSVTNAGGSAVVASEQTAWAKDGSGAPAKGIDGYLSFVKGDWELNLWAYLDAGKTQLAYWGYTKFNVAPNGEITGNVSGSTIEQDDSVATAGFKGWRVYVPMQYIDLDDHDGNSISQNGLIKYNFDGIVMSENPDEAAFDGQYAWFKYTTITNLKTDSVVWDNAGSVDNTSESGFTSYSGIPAPYTVETLYDSLGVYYRIADTVDIHANKTVEVTGKFDNRIRKTFRIYFHDGRVIDPSGTAEFTSSSVYFSGDVDSVNERMGENYFTGFDKSTSGSNILITPYKDYTFEDVIYLPYPASESDNSYRDGYSFWGWYLTDTDWNDSSKEYNVGFTTRTQHPSFVRSLEATVTSLTSQSIFVKNDTSDSDFVTAYGLTLSQFDNVRTATYAGPWDSTATDFYQIHLFARWVLNGGNLAIRTTTSDLINLVDSQNNRKKKIDGYAQISVVPGTKIIQTNVTLTDFNFYEDENGNIIEEKDWGSAPSGTYTYWFLDGFYIDKDSSVTDPEDGRTLVLTNTGILAPYSSDVSRFIDESGNWIKQSLTVDLYAHWTSTEKTK
jgi:hypothetical protein